jgi:hypothetical protein
MSAELHNEAAECRRLSAEFKQKAGATDIPTLKDTYKHLEESYRQLADA